MTMSTTDRGACSPLGAPPPSALARAADGLPPDPGGSPDPGPGGTPWNLSSAEVCEYAGITYRQLDTWVRADRLAPATPAGGSGSRREFTLAEAGVARRMASLIGQGFQLAAAAEIARDYPEARLGVSLANVPAPDLRGPAWHPSVRAPDWRDRAACLDTDPEVFHPELGGTTKPAKRICAGCDVREECLMWALAQPGSLTGIFGGTSGRERARIRAHLSPAGAA